MVLAAKSDPDAADALISQYMGFIRAEAKKLSFGDGEDELSVAMLAFYEATLGYERSRGSFLSFAARVIRSRLIDYNRTESRHRGRLCAYIGYNEELSHKVYAGADMLLMPSRFEPCGLSQMIAMRYGALPIVRETGGLRDSVVPYNQYTGEGTGFTFANYNAHEMKDAVERAVRVYREQPEVWTALMRSAMTADFGFERSAEEYARLYIDIL